MKSQTEEYNMSCFTGEWINENCVIDYYTQIVFSSYFALTTLSTVGYGDMFPISAREQIVGIIFMLGGIVFFS